MLAMQNFTTWFITQLPEFLMAEPICYLWGVIVLGYIVKVFVLSLR